MTALHEVSGEAIILDAAVAPGHDGAAELVISLRHPNGAVESVALDGEIGFHLMKSCGVASAADLAGQPWRRILEGL